MRFADWTGTPPDGPAGLDPPAPAGGPAPTGVVSGGRDGTWLDPATGPGDLSGLPGRVVVGPGDVDADLDGTPDTVALPTGDRLTLFTDLDGDGLADQQLVLGAVPEDPAPEEEPWWNAVGDLVDAVLGR